ncbi:leucine-rich repeat domain-containing protein [Clostridium estertheticum]|uniref:Leucine-rich repeat domain-containing protein n=1 Tax=Clostridium estertheticum TaxID=238834 RepID=A0A7Y3WT20_9CLOT|nr:hypothetical protein [Clostridium estertheticum]NNU76545.1 hypothetical protein [Clostridium estertheticum]WBL49693.1 hypothetical protein LOR37_23515 [Clostridium estertheticum]
MNKKIMSSVLTVLMILGSTSISAFATTDNGSVIIGDKTFDLAYANDPTNSAEINNAIVEGGSVYVKDFSGNWIDNTTGKIVDASVVPGENSTGTISDNTDITSKFTDTNFRSAVYKLIGKTSPAPILNIDVKNIKILDVTLENISSLDGIEYFTALTELDCISNHLTTIDVSKNTALTHLDCTFNQLTTLDVSKNTALTYLSCHASQLTTLDVSKNTALTWLDCFNNQLTTLDVSKDTALTYLDCGLNQITTLYAINNISNGSQYNVQYTDSTRTGTSDNLGITIKK